MKKTTYIGLICCLLLVNIPVGWWFFRVDLTEDHRYSVSAPTKELTRSLQAPLQITLLLDGNLNASFLQLQHAVLDMVQELCVYGDVQCEVVQPDEAWLTKHHLQQLRPTVIHERAQNGQTVQTMIYPYAVIRYQGRQRVVNLLQNTLGLSGQENINRSVEQLEYMLAEGIYFLTKEEQSAVAFLEGHGELPEANVLDLEEQLAQYFTVHRGVIGNDASVLDGYKAIIIADPQTPFSEKDKYILDQYLMRGGRILWVVNGIRFSDDYLASAGKTPVIAADLNIQDMLFRYGVRIEPVLLQDLQCLPVPVDVSAEGEQPNFQPLPWTYAPLLLTSEVSPITIGLGQVSSTFASALSFVGEDELHKEPLLASSNHTLVTGVPAEVDLGLNVEQEAFRWSYLPVGALIEGSFASLFAHRMAPDSLVNVAEKRSESIPTKQIVVAAGSAIRNEVQNGQPLPLGYDRYTQMQFANRDFMVNSILYLTDESGLMPLRQRTLTLRLLNDRQSRDHRATIQALTTILPLLLLALTGCIYLPLRKRKNTHQS